MMTSSAESQCCGSRIRGVLAPGFLAFVTAISFGFLMGGTAVEAGDMVVAQADTAGVSGFSPENHDGVPGVWLDGPAGFEIAKQLHQKTGRPLLVYVYTDWCPYCQKLNKEVLTDKGVQQCLDGFAKVKLNADASQDNKKLASDLRISGYPTLLTRQKDDLMLTRFPTLVPPPQFVAACQEAIKKAGS